MTKEHKTALMLPAPGPMQEINNRGAGNCMYLAYSISLMYYLRTQPEDIRTKIFERLDLNELQTGELNAMLRSTREYTDRERGRIQDILHTPCRALTARSLWRAFLADQQATSLVAVSTFQLSADFKTNLAAEYSQYIEPATPAAATAFLAAEIFQIPNIKAQMSAFVVANQANVIAEFDLSCIPEGEVVPDFQAKGNILTGIIKKYAVKFFEDNDRQQLKTYLKHVETDPHWGNEESLFSLHAAIQGETRMMDDAGRWGFRHDPAIEFGLYKDGVLVGISHPVMALNNRGNTHWTSYVPVTQLRIQPLAATAASRLPPLLGSPAAKTGSPSASSHSVVTPTSSGDLSCGGSVGSELDKTSSPSSDALTPVLPLVVLSEEQKQAKDHFNDLLEALRRKIQEFSDYDEDAARIAAETLYLTLQSASEEYFKNPSNAEQYKLFKNTCEDAIKDPNLGGELSKSRGWGRWLSNLLVAVGTLGIAFLIHKAVTGRYGFFPTDSEKKMDAIASGVNALEALVIP